MRTIVSKFGGSSTANADQFRKILGIIRASPDRRCVVLSAPGVDARHREKVTSLLEDCWRCRSDTPALDLAVERVVARFRIIARDLDLADMDGLVRREVRDATAVSLPHVLSRGEYLCALLFSRYSGIPMIDAAEVIAFDKDGDLDCEGTRRNLEGLADNPDRFVLPGFYGTTPAGRICVFPRNGSDITGALAAAGLGAALYENWTDVPGLMTADPVIVPEARLIPLIGYRQMRALSRAGAQVLHSACLDPVAMAGIPTRLRCTDRPDCFGTLIDEHCERVVPALAMLRDAPLPDSPNKRAACVSAFGIPKELVAEAARVCNPSCIDEGPMAIRMYVAPADGKRCIQQLHRVLIE